MRAILETTDHEGPLDAQRWQTKRKREGRTRNSDEQRHQTDDPGVENEGRPIYILGNGIDKFSSGRVFVSPAAELLLNLAVLHKTSSPASRSRPLPNSTSSLREKGRGTLEDVMDTKFDNAKILRGDDS